jgi:hypothetical protein
VVPLSLSVSPCGLIICGDFFLGVDDLNPSCVCNADLMAFLFLPFDIRILLKPNDPEQKYDPIYDIVIHIMNIHRKDILTMVLQMDE